MSKRKFKIGDSVKINAGKRYLGKCGTIKALFKFNGRLVYCVIDNNDKPIGSGWYAYQLQKLEAKNRFNKYTVTATPYIDGMSNVYWPKYDW